MKTRLIICFILILLLFSGCRSLANQKTTGNNTTPASSSSETTFKPLETSTSFGVETSQTSPVKEGGVTPSASDTASSASSAASSPSGTADNTETPVTTASPSEKMSPKEDVSATLDDILKELNDLDKLYSQMDNLSESDLN